MEEELLAGSEGFYAEAAAAVELAEVLLEDAEGADLLSDPDDLDSEDADGFGLLPVSTEDDAERESVR